MIKQIKKRNGQLVDFDANKLNKWATWASDINGVEWASVALDAVKKCHDRCTTSELQKAMISACIDREDESHLYMAGRLYSAECYKEVFGSFKNIPTLKEMYHKMTNAGLWKHMDYSDDELDIIGSYINHNLDLTYPYNQLFQIKNKYALTNRSTGQCYETPQFTFMRVALGSMSIQPKSTRLNDVISTYKYLSHSKTNAPTPYMLYFGTGHLGLASCCVYISKDDIPSISAGDHIAYMMTCASAGIGAAMLTRSKGDPVRNGTIKHLGKLPYYKVAESNVCANKQAGRGGACTMHFNCLDPEIEDLLRLRHPKTVDDKKIKNIDYSLVYNKLFLQKAAKNEDWMLISYFYAKDLWEAMYSDDLDKFTEKYNHYLSIDVPKKMVNARDIAKLFLVNSYEVGRIYEFAADNANSHTPFNDTIYSSNLCQEVMLPTKPFNGVMDIYEYNSDGEIALCHLMAICAGRVSEEEYEDVAYYSLLMADNAISIMNYPFESLATSATSRRSVGVGITNLAYAMALNNLRYDSAEGKNYMHRLAEMHAYYLYKASLRLAKEKGNAQWMLKTKYPNGWLPIDTYNKNVDLVHTQPLLYDWETLRKQIIDNGGIRNSTVCAMMPCESSSLASNTTNGLYPIRNGVVIKIDEDSKKVFIAPGWEHLSDNYQIAFDIKDSDMTDTYAIFQKFTDQGISADFYKKYTKDDNAVSFKDIFQSWLYRHKMGLKSRYYINSASGVDVSSSTIKEPEEQKGCDGGFCTL